MMPRMIELDGDMRMVATEGELLEFANAVREAGGANVIEALLPSCPQDPESCLIAKALNFECSVETTRGAYADGSPKWLMTLPNDLTDEQLKALRDVKGATLECDDYYCHHLILPEHIGNAAYAFDTGDAFQEYVQPREVA